MKKEIALLDAEITSLEIKRSRSEAAIIEALVMGQDPAEDDVKFFRSYTADIEAKRNRIFELQKQIGM